MTDLSQVKEHAEVIGSDGQHVGTVDNVEGNQIKLTKKDPAADGKHHLIPNDWIESVEGNSVRLNKSAQEAKQNWQSDDNEMLTDSEMAGGSSTASGGANNEQAGASAGSSFSGTASGGGRDLDN